MHSNSSGQQIKVLFIAGMGRSGSTLIDSILGQIEGFFSVGELRLWARKFHANNSCGCGVPLKGCTVWNTILGRALGGKEHVDAYRRAHLSEKGPNLAYGPLALMPRGMSLIKHHFEGYLDKLARIYRAIQDTTGCKVIVDSSKFPLYGYALGMISDIDLYVIHLIRDPRAVAYSWRRQRTRPTDLAVRNDPLFKRKVNPIRSCVKWSISNLFAEMLWGHSHKFMRLRYEDFIVRPREAVRGILSLVGVEQTMLPFIGEHQVLLKPRHTVSGNPSRFKSGVIELSLDDEWKTRLNDSSKRVVTLLTWPLMLKYKYGF